MTAKITLLVSLVAATALTGCQSREIRPFTEEEKQQIRDEAMQEITDARRRLKLTPAQEQRMRPIVMAGFTRRKAILMEYEGQSISAGTARKIQERMRPIGEESKAKLAEFLSAAQMQELEKILQEFRERMVTKLKARA